MARSSSSTFVHVPSSSLLTDSPYPPPSLFEREEDWDHKVLGTASQAADDPIASYCHMNPVLTCVTLPPFRDPHRQPTLQPSTHQFETPTNFAISAYNYNYPQHSRQDVLHIVNASTTTSSPIPSYGHNVIAPSPFESRPLSNFNPSGSNHVPLTQPHSRPRTSTQVFHSPSDLAAHYGIPQFLPPVPSTTPRQQLTPPEKTSEPNTLEDFSFPNICSNYLSMLSQKPMDSSVTDDISTEVAPVTAPEDLETVQALMEVLAASDRNGTASAEFRSPQDLFGEFMTSPFDSPFDEFPPTPALGDSVDADILTSPLMDFVSNDYDMELYRDWNGTKVENILSTPAIKSSPMLDDMYTISSPCTPHTPSLDPQSLYASASDSTVSPPPPPRRKSAATGTRKNLTPDSLVPADAPTQPRKYATPSATSRKEIPAVFARKRARTMAMDEEDQLAEEAYVLPLNPTEAQLIEAKRRQNTIAARRSRKRKLEYQRELEEQNEQLQGDVDKWKRRALTAEALLKHHGLEVPEYDP